MVKFFDKLVNYLALLFMVAVTLVAFVYAIAYGSFLAVVVGFVLASLAISLSQEMASDTPEAKAIAAKELEYKILYEDALVRKLEKEQPEFMKVLNKLLDEQAKQDAVCNDTLDEVSHDSQKWQRDFRVDYAKKYINGEFILSGDFGKK